MGSQLCNNDSIVGEHMVAMNIRDKTHRFIVGEHIVAMHIRDKTQRSIAMVPQQWNIKWSIQNFVYP